MSVIEVAITRVVVVDETNVQVISVATQGPAGVDGAGVPVAGTTGQVLRKVSDADHDTAWDTLTAGDVGADAAGSASGALTSAQAYADDAVSTLDASLATVAKTGSYDDLGNRPTIPSVPVQSVNARTGHVTGLAEASELAAHASDTANPHGVTKTQVGLGNADNTSDANKPVSTAQATALAGKVDNLNLLQFSVPYRDATGTGNPNTNIRVAQLAADTNSIARRTAAGALFINAATVDGHATTKLQMDTADALKVNKAGDAMSGELNISKASGNNMLNVLAEAGGIAEAQFELKSGTTGNSAMRMFMRASDNTFGFYHRGVTRWRVDGNGDFNFNVPRGLRIGVSGQPTPAKMLEVVGDIRANGVDIITGTGFPNGVVTAPVGSTYIDTNSTNGAIEWKKATGTGNTGWVVSVGDTGWRDVTATHFSSLIEVISPFDNGVWMRKTDTQVQISIKGTSKMSSFSGQTVVLPSGFRYYSANTLGGQFYTSTIVGSGIGNTLVYSSLQFVNSTGITTGDRMMMSANFMGNASDGWPTTLPGLAA